jgi:hypothetical protein
LKRLTGVRALLGEGRSDIVSQVGVVSQLSADLASDKTRSLVVITGSAGVGKSVVLREVLRIAAVTALSQQVLSLVIAINLGVLQFTGEDVRSLTGDEPLIVLNTLLRAWRDWAFGIADNNLRHVLTGFTPRNALASPNPRAYLLEPDHLRRLLSAGRVLITLDGIDEFALQYRLRPDAIFTFVSKLRGVIELNPHASLIVGARDTFDGLIPLVGDAEQVYRVALPSADDAERIFPGVKSLLASFQADPRVQDDAERPEDSIANLVLTPLFLQHLAIASPHAELNLATDEKTELYHTTRAEFIMRCLRSLLQTRRPVTHLSEDRRTSLNQIVNILSAIAFSFFDADYQEGAASFRTIATVSTITEHLQLLATRWRAHDNSEASDWQMFVDAVTYFADQEHLRLLFQNSVFLPVGSSQVRFAHDVWQRFLVASYVSHALEHSNLTELSRVILLPDVVYMAGSLFFKRRVWEADEAGQERLYLLIDLLLSRTGSLGVIATVNCLAVLCGNERGDIPSWLITAVMSRASAFHPVPQILVINALSHLGIQTNANAARAARIREAVIPFLRELMQDVQRPWLIRSLVAHYLFAFGDLEAGALPRVQQGALQDTIADVVRTEGQFLENNEWRSLLGAVAGLVKTIDLRHDPASRVIASVHYLFLVAAMFNDTQVVSPTSLRQEMAKLTAGGSAYLNIARAATQSDALIELLDYCKTSIHGT